jgi:FkbM family methyltransferase
MSYLVSVARNAAARTTRFMPRLRGHRRLSRKLNSFFLKRGCAPLVVAQMRLGHEMLIDTRSGTESYALYSGDYDTQKIRFLMSLMRRNSVFLDVGANVGFYTLPMARRAALDGGRVYAFEPHPSNFSRLEHNVARNHLEHVVTLLEVALSSQAGEAELTMREDFAQGSETGNASIYIDHEAERAFPTVRITTVALDDLYGATVPRVDIIKLDIEGHEDVFLSGARRTISEERPIIMTEVNKEYYRRRGVDLYGKIRENLSAEYGVYLPTADWKAKLTVSDVFDSLTSVSNFDSCAEIDNAFLIPDEKFPLALQSLRAIH